MNEEEIKQKKLEELKEKYLKQQEEARKQDEVESKMQMLLNKILEEDAKARINNVRLVNPQLYSKAFRVLMTMAQKGYLQQGKLNDAQMKEILMELKEEKEIRIRRM